MDQKLPYYPYSEYLKEKYGEKVYKLPVNLPATCPNRLKGSGCAFCSELGTGFVAMVSHVPVQKQIERQSTMPASLSLIFRIIPIPFCLLNVSGLIWKKRRKGRIW